MFTQQTKQQLYDFLPLLPWLLLFIAITGAIYAVAQAGNAALLTLFIAGYIICLNFSIPTPVGHITFAPTLAFISLFLLGPEITLLTLASSIVLAELVFPIWRPLWHTVPLTTPNSPEQQPAPSRLRYTAGQTAVYLLTFTCIIWLTPLPNIAQLNQTIFTDWSTIGPLFLTILPAILLYLIIYPLAYLGTKPLLHFTFYSYIDQALPYLLLTHLGLPFIFMAVLVYGRFTLPIFIGTITLFLIFNLIWWAVWQNNHTLSQQIQQLTRLNHVATQQRETLDVSAIVHRAYEQITALIEVDEIAIYLFSPEEDRWLRPLAVAYGRSLPPFQQTKPGDFIDWVQNNGRTLDIDRSTIHYANSHQLTPPSPLPHHWLGIPLQTNERTLGVLVLQQHTPNRLLDRWRRELLTAIARQTSDGLDNAQRHSETLRLYTETDEALAERVEQLQAVLNTTNEAIALLNTAGDIILANPLAQKLIRPEQKLGYTLSQWHRFAQKNHPTDPVTTHNEVISLPLNNQTRWFQRSTTAVNHNGSQLGWLIVLHDITELQERAQWREQFTNMVVHDLRNPITTLLTNFDFITRTLTQNSPPSQLKLADRIQTGRHISHHMLDMVDSLLDAARLSAGQLIADAEAMHLLPQIKQVIQQMETQFIYKQIEFSLNTPANLPPVWADRELVRRILVNLLDNAIKFTPPNGEIAVTLTPHKMDENHETGILCAIRDTGPGIPLEQHEEVFGQFVQITPGGGQTRGAGIGLSFCRQALSIQNGRIWVENPAEANTGVVFIFTLPGIPHFNIS